MLVVRSTSTSLAIVALSLGLSTSLQAREAIGIISTSGHFTVEGAQVWGNSTLFDGARVETQDASSQLALSSGVKVQLAAGSAVQVYKDRLVLSRGVSQVTSPARFTVDAGGLDVLTDKGRFQVGLDRGASGGEVSVASVTGTARITRRGSGVLASLPAGGNMSFTLSQAISRSGCLLFKDGGFILQVDDSPEVIQLTGPDLAANVGNRIEVQGMPSTIRATIAPATSVFTATSITPRAQGGCLTAAAALNAQTTAGQLNAAGPAANPTAPVAGTQPSPAQVSTGGGMSTGAKVALVGLIGGGGAGAALALAGKKESTSP